MELWARLPELVAQAPQRQHAGLRPNWRSLLRLLEKEAFLPWDFSSSENHRSHTNSAIDMHLKSQTLRCDSLSGKSRSWAWRRMRAQWRGVLVKI